MINYKLVNSETLKPQFYAYMLPKQNVDSNTVLNREMHYRKTLTKNVKPAYEDKKLQRKRYAIIWKTKLDRQCRLVTTNMSH